MFFKASEYALAFLSERVRELKLLELNEKEQGL